MSKKIKKKQKRHDQKESPGEMDDKSDVIALKKKIVKLEKELDDRNSLIKSLQVQIKKSGPGKGKKGKTKKQGSRALFKRQTSGIGVLQKQARQCHGYLLHRYEYYLSVEPDKGKARTLAGQDLIDKFGSDAGYSAEELEHILS